MLTFFFLELLDDELPMVPVVPLGECRSPLVLHILLHFSSSIMWVVSVPLCVSVAALKTAHSLHIFHRTWYLLVPIFNNMVRKEKKFLLASSLAALYRKLSGKSA
jgi:hypothetical protein